MLLGTRGFGVLGGSSPVGAAGVGHLCLVELPASAFVSFFFLSLFLLGLFVLRPQLAGCIGWTLLYNLKPGETLFHEGF